MTLSDQDQAPLRIHRFRMTVAYALQAGADDKPIVGITLTVHELGSDLVANLEVRLVTLGCRDRGEFLRCDDRGGTCRYLDAPMWPRSFRRMTPYPGGRR